MQVKRAIKDSSITLLLIFWILPVIFFGILNTESFWVPRCFDRFINVSRLFPHRQSGWLIYRAEALYESEESYRPLSEKKFFEPQPYGGRRRFQRIFDFANEAELRRLAIWICERAAHENSEKRILRIRFLSYTVRHEEYPLPPLGRYDQDRYIEAFGDSGRIVYESPSFF